MKTDSKNNLKQRRGPMNELKIPLRVTNIVMTGKLPIDHKLDFRKFIASLDGWQVINEHMSPIVQKSYIRNDGTIARRTNRKSRVSVAIWTSGALNITGLRSLEEGREILNKAVKEMQMVGIL